MLSRRASGRAYATRGRSPPPGFAGPRTTYEACLHRLPAPGGYHPALVEPPPARARSPALAVPPPRAPVVPRRGLGAADPARPRRPSAAGPSRLAPGARPLAHRGFGRARRAVRPKGLSRAARPEIRDLGSLPARPPPVRPAPRPASAGSRAPASRRPAPCGPRRRRLRGQPGAAPRSAGCDARRGPCAPAWRAAHGRRSGDRQPLHRADGRCRHRSGWSTQRGSASRRSRAAARARSTPRRRAVRHRGSGGARGADGGRSGRRRTRGGPPVVRGSGRSARRVQRPSPRRSAPGFARPSFSPPWSKSPARQDIRPPGRWGWSATRASPEHVSRPERGLLGTRAGTYRARIGHYLTRT